MTDGQPFSSRTRSGVEAYLASAGEVFTAFREQDSGCVSYGVAAAGRRWFVKHASAPSGIAGLRRAIRLHAAVRHPAIVPLRQWVHTADGLALVYPWVDGAVLYGPAGARGSPARTDPASAHARFRALPVPVVLAALDAMFDAHAAISRAGFVAVDLYDGCVLYDFHRATVRLIDLDEYQPRAFVVAADRLPGSRRFMPPEHWQRGARVDDRSTVFLLGRMAQVLLDEGDLEERWRGSHALHDVTRQATAPQPRDRHASVAAFVAAWQRAR